MYPTDFQAAKYRNIPKATLYDRVKFFTIYRPKDIVENVNRNVLMEIKGSDKSDKFY